MSDRFRDLPEEKHRVILSAAMEVFAKYDYKKASTDLIATKAGISKGSLFYYFRNKKELYLCVYHYVLEIVTEELMDPELMKITDFYNFIIYASEKKMRLLEKYPYILDFSVRSFYSEKEEISDGIKSVTNQEIRNTFDIYFKDLELKKFKEGIDPRQIYRMLVWMIDGYMHEQRMYGRDIQMDLFRKEFFSWIRMFRNSTYREEYL